MSGIEPRDPIEDHGASLDEDNKRVRCNYCGKEMNGFCRLKHHLGAVGSDVVACEVVPADIKAQMKNSLLEKRKERLLKEVGKLYHPDLPSRRTLSSKSNEFVSSPVKQSQSQTLLKGKKAISPEIKTCSSKRPNLPMKRSFSSHSGELDYILPEETHHTTSEDLEKFAKPLAKNAINCNVHSFCTITKLRPASEKELKEESAMHATRCIAQFLYEAGLDLSVVKYPSFRRMIDAAVSCGTGYELPSIEELKGYMLQGEVKKVEDHVEEVKKTRGRTGCSILMDGWIDDRGQNLMIFLVDCPQGTTFLKSVDASAAIRDVDKLFVLLNEVVEEVGIENVVQVVSHGTSCYLEAAGKMLMEKHLTLYWTLSASYCINLILEKIGAIDHIKKVLDKAKSITKFIYSHALPLALMRKHIHGKNLVKTSNLKFLSPFVTLEAMVAEKENLLNMFNSTKWTSSVWASKDKGKAIADLVKCSTFWAAAYEVLKGTVPLVTILRRTNDDDKTAVGCIYEAMDRAKETIRVNFENEEARYMPFWNVIDEIWDNYLHSPLHSAGYYLNPSLFYSNDFYVDAEVANGLLSCIVRMVEDRHKQDLIVLQLDAYRAASGQFAEANAIDERTKLPASLWWSLHGGGTPELQNFAVRVLSQTCGGASMHKLNRRVAEQLHQKGRNCMEQERLRDIEFVHYNMRLWQSPTYGLDPEDDIVQEDIDMMDESVIEG